MNAEQIDFANRNATRLEAYAEISCRMGFIRPCDVDELYSYLNEKLCRAATKYDSSKSHDRNEKAYVNLILRCGVLSFKDKQDRIPVLNTLPEEFELEDKSKIQIDMDLITKLMDLAGISKRDRVILLAYYISGLDTVVIGAAANLVPETVRQIILRALKRMGQISPWQIEDFYV